MRGSLEGLLAKLSLAGEPNANRREVSLWIKLKVPAHTSGHM